MHFSAQFQSSNSALPRSNLQEWRISFYLSQVYQDFMQKNHGHKYPYIDEAAKTQQFNLYLLLILQVVPFWRRA